jgi:hypothetical protein
MPTEHDRLPRSTPLHDVLFALVEFGGDDPGGDHRASLTLLHLEAPGEPAAEREDTRLF